MANRGSAYLAADAVLIASGTATLEAMLCKRPMVVAYKMAKLTRFIMGYMYKPEFFALPNLPRWKADCERITSTRCHC